MSKARFLVVGRRATTVDLSKFMVRTKKPAVFLPALSREMYVELRVDL